MTEVEQQPERRRPGKVIEMSVALKDHPFRLSEEVAGYLQSRQSEIEADGRTVQFSRDAAQQLELLENLTGQPAESVLAMALGLLETLVLAKRDGRQMMLVNRFGIPLSKVVLPS